MKYGVYDHVQGVWLFVCETFSEAQRALWSHDSKDAAVYPAPAGVDTKVKEKPDGEPQFGGSPSPLPTIAPASGAVPVSGSDPTPEPIYVPQEEVAVVGTFAPAAPPAPEETTAADPEVAADVSAQTVRHEGSEEDAQPTQTRRQTEGGAEKCQ